MESVQGLSMTNVFDQNACQVWPENMTDEHCLTTQSTDMNIVSSIWNSSLHRCELYTSLVVIISFHLIYVMSRDKKQKLDNTTRLKLYTTVMLSGLSLIQFFTNTENAVIVGFNGKHGFSPLILAGIFGMLAALTVQKPRRGTFGISIALLAFWFLMLVSTSNTIYSHFVSDTSSLSTADLLLELTRLLGVLLMFTLSCLTEKPSPQASRPSSKAVHPEDSASWYADVTLSWSTSMVWTGFKRTLEETDVPGLASRDQCRHVVPRLEQAWKQEEFRCKLSNESQASRKDFDDQQQSDDSLLETSPNTGTGPTETTPVDQASLLRALLKAYGLKFVFLQTIKTMLEMHDFIEPLLTAMLMTHIQDRESDSMWKGINILVCIFVLKCFTEIAHHRNWYSICRLSRHMKTSVIMIIFKKSMTLQNECKKDKTNGEIVNLISDDCDRVFNMAQHIFLIAMTPLKITIALYFLYTSLGWSMLVGVAIMLLLIPLNTFIGKRMKNINEHRNEVKDKRVKLMNEIVSGIKVLKLYAWEKSFMAKVNGIRSEEVNACKTRCKYNAAIDSMFRAIPFLVKVGAFGTFLLLGGHLDTTKGFLTISLFHTLNHPLSLMAILMPVYMEALVSLKRITKFLNGEDISFDVIKKSSKGPSAVSVKDGTFSWERSSPKPTLSNISVDIPKGGLVAIVGMVGSGKSSLLSSMMGEMEKLDGDVEIQGRVAYVPQEAWILNDTLQDNVLFGCKLDKRKYHRVVHSCSLKSDINIMAAGDKTEIGEKGINLSGGQKQRVSLARAVYNDADVYLLDDPLSAVDAHVGKNIFQNVISHDGVLKGKTRVLVTHGIHWLPLVDSIIVMKDGTVSETGTYKELVSQDGVFAQFLRDLCSNTSNDDDTEVSKLKQNIYKRLTSRDVQEPEQTAKERENIQNLSKETVNEELDSDEHDGDFDDKPTNGTNAKIIDEEELEQGAVNKSVYIDYLRAVGMKSVIAFMLMFFVTIVADNYNTYAVKAWTDDTLLANTSLSGTQEYVDRLWFHFNTFVVSGSIEVIAAFLFILFTMKGGFQASKRIHDNLLDTILKCPMSFFDTTPSCRVVNRFSTDIGRVDGLTGCLRAYIERFLALLTCLFLIVINAPTILIILVPVSGVYYLLHHIHISSVRQLRRYRSKHRSPMFVHFSETLSGVSSIRAYSCQNRFVQTMENKLEQWCKFDNMELAVALWFGMRMVILSLFIQMVAGVVVVMDTRMTAGMAYMVLMYAGQFSGNLGSLVHLMTHVETEIVSLERVLDYTKKPKEAPWEIAETKPAVDWPKNGHVVLKDFKARYREGLDLVLKGVDCDIKNGEKIGIVGRTGAGKSSLTMALFRLVEAANGYIEVDQEKTSDLGLHDLRSKITILPQEPVIFAGTLRMNLDPFDKCSTEELWLALQHSHLKSFVESLPHQLDFECGEGGKNLSVGQRQLLCLARTLLRQTRILVLDEATAAVDIETDELIQKTIRTEFKDCTVLTIAHRLNTIMDYDRILVLDQGTVKEFDSPSNLLADKQTTFYSMAKDAKLVT